MRKINPTTGIHSIMYNQGDKRALKAISLMLSCGRNLLSFKVTHEWRPVLKPEFEKVEEVPVAGLVVAEAETLVERVTQETELVTESVPPQHSDPPKVEVPKKKKYKFRGFPEPVASTSGQQSAAQQASGPSFCGKAVKGLCVCTRQDRVSYSQESHECYNPMCTYTKKGKGGLETLQKHCPGGKTLFHCRVCEDWCRNDPRNMGKWKPLK